MFKSVILILVGAVLMSGCRGPVGLTPDTVFRQIQPDAFWLETAEQIQGETAEEKYAHAMTTVEMRAVSIYDSSLREKALNEAAQQLLALQDAEGQALFLQAHSAWRHYVDRQAQWMTDSDRDGSARPLFIHSIRNEEFSQRTRLYRELVEQHGSSDETL